MNNSEPAQIGDKVLILHPAHVAGKVGIICAQEEFSNEQTSSRWLIQIDSENIVVSLSQDEFQRIKV